MKQNNRNAQPVGKTGCAYSIQKRGDLRLVTEWLQHSKKPYALRKIHQGSRIAIAGFLDLFKRAKQ